MAASLHTRRQAGVVLALLLPLFCSAQAPPVPVEPAAQARTWLSRMQVAADAVSYQGTMVVSAGGSLSSSRVWHYGVGDQRYERREALDGEPHQVLRRNDEVQTRWPKERVLITERRQLPPVSRGAALVIEARAADQYRVQREGLGRVAGREADIFLLQPRDALRYAQRLWADRATGLMLRADVIGAQNEVLESASYTEIEIDVRPQPEVVTRDWKRTDGYRVVGSAKRRTDLETEGWVMDGPVSGFALQGCVKRPIAASGEAGADAGEVGTHEVMQVLFSDGLTHVSVFIEPYREPRHRSSPQMRSGATSTLTMRRGNDWITAVGDVPGATLRLFVDSLERQR